MRWQRLTWLCVVYCAVRALGNAPSGFTSIPASTTSPEGEPLAHQAARALLGVSSTLQVGGECRFVVNPGDNKYTLNLNTDPGSIKVTTPAGSQLKVYRPAVFNNLRRHAGVSDDLYLKCLDVENLVCLSSDSKSGQAFWKTKDETLVLKTLKHYEAINLLSCLLYTSPSPRDRQKSRMPSSA